MPKAARRYEIYLPVSFNDGSPIPNEHFEFVEKRLLARFGGLTSHAQDSPLRGIWVGPQQQYLDHVIIIAAMDFRRQGSTKFIAELKQDLLREFEQLEILVTELPLRVH